MRASSPTSPCSVVSRRMRASTRWTEYQGPEHHRSGVSQPGRERVRPSPADWASARPDRDHARRVRHLDCRCPLLSLLAEITGGCAVLLKVAARADEAAL